MMNNLQKDYMWLSLLVLPQFQFENRIKLPLLEIKNYFFFANRAQLAKTRPHVGGLASKKGVGGVGWPLGGTPEGAAYVSVAPPPSSFSSGNLWPNLQKFTVHLLGSLPPFLLRELSSLKSPLAPGDICPQYKIPLKWHKHRKNERRNTCDTQITSSSAWGVASRGGG